MVVTVPDVPSYATPSVPPAPPRSAPDSTANCGDHALEELSGGTVTPHMALGERDDAIGIEIQPWIAGCGGPGRRRPHGPSRTQLRTNRRRCRKITPSAADRPAACSHGGRHARSRGANDLKLDADLVRTRARNRGRCRGAAGLGRNQDAPSGDARCASWRCHTRSASTGAHDRGLAQPGRMTTEPSPRPD